MGKEFAFVFCILCQKPGISAGDRMIDKGDAMCYPYKGLLWGFIPWGFRGRKTLKDHDKKCERRNMTLLEKLKEKLHREEPGQLKREILWLLGQMKRFRRQIGMVSLLGLLATVLGLGSSVASKYLIDAVTGGIGRMLAPAACLMAGMVLLSLLLQGVSARAGAAIHVRVKNELQHGTYSRILRGGWEALEPYRSGDLLNRLTADVGNLSEGIIGFLPGLITSGAKFVGAFFIILYYDPVMAVIALLGVPVTLGVSRLMLRRMRRHSLQMKELTGQVMSFQEDSFRNLTSIKAFSVTSWFEREMQHLQGTYADAYLSYNAFQIGASSFLSLVGMVVTASCFGWGVYQLWNGSITYGSLTLFLQLASTLRGAFSSLVSLGQQAISLTTSAGRILAVEDLPEEDCRLPEGLAEEKTLHIRMKDVSFRYRTGETVLESFAFTADYGDLIAITGPSGEGKTTLLRLLLGLIEPESGEGILVGGSGRTYPLSAGTRSVFAYVPQGSSVFAGTIRENLRLVRPEATEEEMTDALKTACAWDFVNQFPDGLDHPLGAGGRGISEGQAQRLAIARALLRKAPILLLDEATSGLDEGTEKQLLQNLRSWDSLHTCILVTHRPGSASFCSRAYEIRRGSVTEVTDE
jgi:ABC-type multidrug transport system fused ATPase/permease subunit